MLGVKILNADVPDRFGRAARALKNPGAAMRDLGGHIVRRISKSFPRLPRGQASQPGQPPARHRRGLAVFSDVRRDGEELHVGSPDVQAEILHAGGDIVPKTARALAVPIHRDAYGKRPRDIPGLVPIPARPGQEPEDRGILARVTGKDKALTPMFALRARVRIRPHPWANVTDEDWDYGLVAIKAQADRELLEKG